MAGAVTHGGIGSGAAMRNNNAGERGTCHNLSPILLSFIMLCGYTLRTEELAAGSYHDPQARAAVRQMRWLGVRRMYRFPYRGGAIIMFLARP